ncbi:MAG: YkgJ family cysteine cluster protein [Bacteroidales bacterium]
MNTLISEFFLRSKSDTKKILLAISKLKKKPPKNLDITLQALHNFYSEKINCLDCARCCKSISPALKNSDVLRLSKHLKIKPSDIVEQYFDTDADNDFVFKKQPCPFLMDDNYCSIYSFRPRACKEYPHTDRRRAAQILSVHTKNISICPIVFHVFKDITNKQY